MRLKPPDRFCLVRDGIDRDKGTLTHDFKSRGAFENGFFVGNRQHPLRGRTPKAIGGELHLAKTRFFSSLKNLGDPGSVKMRDELVSKTQA